MSPPSGGWPRYLVSVIYRNTDLTTSLYWQPDPNKNAGDIARTFLSGEYELLSFTRVRSAAVADLRLFLNAVAGAELSVRRAHDGEILVRSGNESLVVTGQTAYVLRGYLDEETVTMQDRFDMTQRLHAM